ncbi:hypothetical protein E3150_14040 [Escherichia coli O157:H7]|nr:hypothetical protein [Escherichia coli]QKA96393.1 hypothetical protein E3162_14945 [Escherichia coli O157:H7]EFI3964889.1 hypothetical protein [Escherichia coli]EFI5454550.1 hypothetical protein [Escherichia coli]EFI7688214.1 hypothetical protein [Escherichia coli]
MATSSGKHKITSIFNERLNRLFVTVCHWLSLSVTIEVVVILPDRAILRFALISVSYRRNRSGFFQWYVIFSFSRYSSTRRL